jgi:hypothetical protein
MADADPRTAYFPRWVFALLVIHALRNAFHPYWGRTNPLVIARPPRRIRKASAQPEPHPVILGPPKVVPVARADDDLNARADARERRFREMKPGALPTALTKIRLGKLLRSANLFAMNTPEKSTRRDLAERLVKLWKSPALEQAKKTAASYLATVLARLNEALGSRNPKK